MKKILLSIFALTAMVASACQYVSWDFLNWNQVYIYSVNWKAIHFSPTSNGAKNDIEVDLPISVQIGVNDIRREEVSYKEKNGEVVDGTYIENYTYYSIRSMKLYYKVERQGSVIKRATLVKKLDNLDWKMAFNKPLELFGSGGIIDIPNYIKLEKGDVITIWIGVDAGIFTNGLDESGANALNGYPNTKNGEDYPPYLHVFRVIYSGKKRIII